MNGPARAAPSAERLVSHLLHIAKTRESISESRAALAELRRGMTDPVRVAKHVAPHLSDSLSMSQEKRCYWIAELFAWHSMKFRNMDGYQKGVSLGNAFRQIKDDSGSIEKRLFALLATPSDSLQDRMRHAVRLLASRSQPLDWYRLLDDLMWWDLANKPRQMRLAKDFYGRPADDAATDTTDETTPEEGEDTP